MTRHYILPTEGWDRMSSDETALLPSDQTLLVFESAKDYGPISQPTIHSVVYMLKQKEILPFQTYSFTSYFRPFSRSLQEDIDDAVAFQFLDEDLKHFSMAEWVYSITEQGSKYICSKIDATDAKIISSARTFVREKLSHDRDVLLDEAYRSLNEELAKQFSDR